MYSVEATHCNIPPCIMQLLKVSSRYCLFYASEILYYRILVFIHKSISVCVYNTKVNVIQMSSPLYPFLTPKLESNSALFCCILP